MNRLILALVIALTLLAPAGAQTTRPVNLSWGLSPATNVTGYSIYRCTIVPPVVSCIPATTTALVTVSASTTTYTDPAVVTQTAYGYSIVANAAACSGTSSLTTNCGNSAPLTLSNVPVPPQTPGATNIVVVVP